MRFLITRDKVPTGAANWINFWTPQTYVFRDENGVHRSSEKKIVMLPVYQFELLFNFEPEEGSKQIIDYQKIRKSDTTIFRKTKGLFSEFYYKIKETKRKKLREALSKM